jgi:hypothetical protein
MTDQELQKLCEDLFNKVYQENKNDDRVEPGDLKGFVYHEMGQEIEELDIVKKPKKAFELIHSVSKAEKKNAEQVMSDFCDNFESLDATYSELASWIVNERCYAIFEKTLGPLEYDEI